MTNSKDQSGAIPAPAGNAWPVRNSRAYTFDSRIVGDTMAVGTWSMSTVQFGMDAPSSPPQLVYVLDGSFALGMTSAMCMLQLVDLIKPGFPPLFLVGLDYPVDAPNARSRDYTMADCVPEPMASQLAGSPKTAQGGADNFLRFLEEELDPWVRANHEVSERPAGILGDSFGGTFTFHAFTRQSKLFDRYWLGSPGIFTTGTDHVAAFAETLRGDLVHDSRMYLSFGELEASGGGVEFYEDMGRNFGRILKALEGNGNARLDWRSRIYPGHTHTTVFAPALNDALLYLYGPYLPEG